MHPVALARSAGRAVAALVWPARCVACDALVPEDRTFCPTCAVSVLPAEPACPRCAGPVDAYDAWLAQSPPRHPPGRHQYELRGGSEASSASPSTCRLCRAAPPPWAAVTAAALYGGALVAPLLAFKHGDKRHLARPLARLLVPSLGSSLRHGVQAVVPVPLHPRRLRARGFNQALDLLRAGLAQVARETPTIRKAGTTAAQKSPPQILVDALVRLRDTPPLGHLSPRERHAEVSAAFVARPSLLRGRHAVLVDDVMTTGATVSACTRALRDAGAASVRIVVLARAWPREA